MADEIVRTYFDTPTGKYIFDAYLSIKHDSNLAITEHPIQSGANIADHAYMEAKKLNFEIGMSDVMSDISDVNFNKFNEDNSRSVNAFQILRKLQEDRIPIKVINRLWNYNHMLIETISATEDSKTTYGLKASVTLKEIFVVNVTTVKISERPQKSEVTNEGDQKPQQANESLLSRLFN